MLKIAHLTINNNNTLTHLLKYNTELYRNLSGMGDLTRYWPSCLCTLVCMLSKTFKSLGFPIYVLFQKRVVYTISTISLLSTIRYKKTYVSNVRCTMRFWNNLQVCSKQQHLKAK